MLAAALGAVALTTLMITVTFRSRTEKYSLPLIQRAGEQISETLNHDVRSLRTDTNEHRESLAAYYSGLDRKIADIGSRLEQQAGEISQLRHRVANMDSSLSALRAESREHTILHTNELQRVNGDLEKLAGSSRETQTTLTTIGSSLDEARRVLAHLQQVPDRLNDESQRISRLSEQAGETRRQADLKLTALKSALDQNAIETERLMSFRQHTMQQMSDIMAGAERSGRQLGRVDRALRQRLELEAGLRTGECWQVLDGGLFTGRPAAADILPLLYLALLRSLSLSLLFEEQQERWTMVYLLRSGPPDVSPEEQFATLLDACTSEIAAAIPGLAEFKSLVLGIYSGGPAVLAIGPMVLVRTENDLISSLGPRVDGLLALEILCSPDAYAEQLRQSPAGAFRSLAAWADGY